MLIILCSSEENLRKYKCNFNVFSSIKKFIWISFDKYVKFTNIWYAKVKMIVSLSFDFILL